MSEFPTMNEVDLLGSLKNTSVNSSLPLAADLSLWDKYSHSLTATRQQKLLEAAKHRSNHFRLVVQDIHHPHNVSACMRSAEAFGILNVDVVNQKEKFNATGPSCGVSDWLRVRKYTSVADSVANLRQNGYKIVGGVASKKAVSIYELDVKEPLAIVFGNEAEGLAPEWLEHLDGIFTIPMVGLVESLNISVSAAITLFELTRRAKLELPPEVYYLSESERAALLLEWLKKERPYFFNS